MEKYLGLSTTTIMTMRFDLMTQLEKSIMENSKFPKDQLLYQRVRRIANTIAELTDELEFRNDEIIVRIP